MAEAPGIDLTEETIFTWGAPPLKFGARFSFPSAPERHLAAAALLAPDRDKLNDPSEQLPSAVVDLIRDIGIPNGIGAVGYAEADIPPGRCERAILQPTRRRRACRSTTRSHG